MRLVLRIPVIAKGLALGVEHNGAVVDTVVRLVVNLQPPQHIDDAIHRAGGFAGFVAQIRHRVKGAVQIRRAVNQQ